ncbi:MAG: hypothetical protein HY510_06905, partial [Acidobacteria bacterium]|nr:hypothetical protein [Acidobacteriota bacterium]
LGAAASKAGALIILAVGGEGFGYRDPSDGRLVLRRRISRGLADAIPTPLELIVGGVVVQSGRFDAVDSVARLSPTMIGFAFNTRLLGGGVAGEPDGPGKANKNPDGLPAGENLAMLAFGAHRMAETQQRALQAIPAYVLLFREAFPGEAAEADATLDLDLLINDDTAARAVAAFLRTTVTRATAWDRFLAGDDDALSPRQVRGALLFARPTGEGGANCIACHSGPMLNKALGDEDGALVEENFHNVGIGDHPLRDLARAALGDPSHRDIGRAEANGDAGDAFEFKTPVLRQLRDGGQFTHAGAFGSVREVVEYFNAGIPKDPDAAAAGNLSPLFTRPRGPGEPPGLGLTTAEIDALVDFLESALHDPAFVRDDPSSATRAFDPTPRDLAYSIYRPDLAALGARNGLMPSGLAPLSNDPLTRRDFGLELLDVTDQVRATRSLVPAHAAGAADDPMPGSTQARVEILSLENIGADPIDTDLMVVLRRLPEKVVLMNPDGATSEMPEPFLPYRRLFLGGGLLRPGESVDLRLRFAAPPRVRPDYEVVLFSGQRAP